MAKIKTYASDLLIIGAGGAGLRAAIAAHDKGCKVIVIGKEALGTAHTSMAAGGINAALGTVDAADTWQIHVADTFVEGGKISNPKMVELLCRNAPAEIYWLLENGCRLARTENGTILQRYFGAHTYRRTCYYGDETGKEILRVLAKEAKKRKIQFFGKHYVEALLKANDGSINGALAINMKNRQFTTFNSKAVLLAAGGYTRLYSRSTSRQFENIGDSVALAFEVGAELMDMEMVQFHPTGMVWPKKMEGTLVTEAVRGEGGLLFNSKNERFMSKYDPERMELGTRDVVARANYQEIMEGRGTEHMGVWLDITHISKEEILEKLPKMYRVFKKIGIDISKKRMEVAPTAHYSMGGIKIMAETGATNVPSLHVVGEASSGVHGGNRLGGNSLAEVVVFGNLYGSYLAENLKGKKLKPLDKKYLENKLEEMTIGASPL